MLRKLLSCIWIACFLGFAGLQSCGADELAGDDPFGEIICKKTVEVSVTASEAADLKLDIKEELQRTLDEPTQMDFTETPLSDVIDYLKDYHKQKHRGFEIVLDTKALGEKGIAPDLPVTINVKGISLRSALRHVLRPQGLACVIRNEVLLITTAEEACFTKVYDVADLVSPKDGEKSAPLESLTSMIAKTCSPPGKPDWPGWVASLKSVEVTAIVVHQPEEYQDQVADLLAQLRGVKH